MATRLQTGMGVVMTVAAEPSDGGFRLVTQAGDVRHLYQVSGAGGVELLSSDYHFANSPTTWHDVEHVALAPVADWGRDMLAWQRGFDGTTSPDADRDGDVDGSDFLAWQRESSSASSPGTAAQDIALAAWQNRFGAVGLTQDIEAASAPTETTTEASPLITNLRRAIVDAAMAAGQEAQRSLPARGGRRLRRSQFA